MASSEYRHFATLGMFILDEFEYLDELGDLLPKSRPTQIGGGGTYAAIGARIWLPAENIAMIVDRGNDFPSEIQTMLENYGNEMWHFRDDLERPTTRAVNRYFGEHRGFEYLTARIKLTPRDLLASPFTRPTTLHFICSPTRAVDIVNEVRNTPDWNPVTIFEPIPDRCIPEELEPLIRVLPGIFILSPNAEEALSLLSLPQPPSKEKIEKAARQFLHLGVGPNGKGHVIIRSGAMGAYVVQNESDGMWIDAFFSELEAENVIDVTGAGNSFLGGLSAGLLHCNGDVKRAAFYATVSASFTVQQFGLPRISDRIGGEVQWNGDSPTRRLLTLQRRHKEISPCT